MSQHKTPTGLEPLIEHELFWELYDIRQTHCFIPDSASRQTVLCKPDASPLSPEAIKMLTESPHLLFKVVAYLQQPSPETLKAVKGAVASCLGIVGWARSDYEIKDPRVGL
jgi:hypothetical protein